MNYVVNCFILFNLHVYLSHVFNLEVHCTLFILYMSAFHVWYQVVRAVSYYSIIMYVWCVIFVVIAIVTVLKKFIVVVGLFIFYSLLGIDLCLGVLGLVVIKVFIILIIRYFWCLIHNVWYC